MGRFVKGQTGWNKGKTNVYSKETLLKMSLGRKGKPISLEHKMKISKALKGIKRPALSEQHKNSLRLGWIGRKLKGLGEAWNKGRAWSKESKIKMSKAQEGDKSHRWLGGKSYLQYNTDWTRTFRQSIRERDRLTCQLCGEGQTDELLAIHHIDYNKQNCNPTNLISLCRKCHARTNSKRDYWINYFKKV